MALMAGRWQWNKSAKVAAAAIVLLGMHILSSLSAGRRRFRLPIRLRKPDEFNPLMTMSPPSIITRSASARSGSVPSITIMSAVTMEVLLRRRSDENWSVR